MELLNGSVEVRKYGTRGISANRCAQWFLSAFLLDHGGGPKRGGPTFHFHRWLLVHLYLQCMLTFVLALKFTSTWTLRLTYAHTLRFTSTSSVKFTKAWEPNVDPMP